MAELPPKAAADEAAKTPLRIEPAATPHPSPGKPAKVGAKSAAARRSRAKGKAALRLRTPVSATDWEDLMAMADLDGVRPYAMCGQFAKGEVIRHKVFGLGIVVREITEGKIQVSFQDGVRLLACNRRR